MIRNGAQRILQSGLGLSKTSPKYIWPRLKFKPP